MCQKASRHEVAESSFIRGGGPLRRFKHLQTLLPLLPDSAELRSADQHPVNQLFTNQEGGGGGGATLPPEYLWLSRIGRHVSHGHTAPGMEAGPFKKKVGMEGGGCGWGWRGGGLAVDQRYTISQNMWNNLWASKHNTSSHRSSGNVWENTCWLAASELAH